MHRVPVCAGERVDWCGGRRPANAVRPRKVRAAGQKSSYSRGYAPPRARSGPLRLLRRAEGAPGHGPSRVRGARGSDPVGTRAIPGNLSRTAPLAGFVALTTPRGSVEDPLDALPDAVVVVGASGDVRYANPAALDLFRETETRWSGTRSGTPPTPAPTRTTVPRWPSRSPLRAGPTSADARRPLPLVRRGVPGLHPRRHRSAQGRGAAPSRVQLRQQQRLEAVGVLAGGVAHDFNNMLSVVLSYTNLALETLSDADPLKQDMLEIRKELTSAPRKAHRASYSPSAVGRSCCRACSTSTKSCAGWRRSSRAC